MHTSTITPAPLDLDPTVDGQSAEGITAVCATSLARAQGLLDEIRALDGASAASWENTFGKLDDATLAIRTASELAQLMGVAHPNKAVREAAKACEPKVDAFTTAIYLDPRLASAFKQTARALEGQKLPTSHARLVEHTLRDYRRNGLDLDAAGQARLRELNEEITRVSQQYETNVADATLSISVTPAQLKGLPPSYLETHKPGPDGRVTLTTDYPDYFPVLQYVEDRSVALELYKKFDNRAAEKNVALLDRLLLLRREKARLLGYATWADYVLEPRMAKTSKTVADFLERLRKHVAHKGAEEMREFRAMHASLGGNVNDPIPPSDRVYLEDKLRQKKYGLDSQAVTEYFDVSLVKKGLLDITSQIYGIEYRETKAPVWHPDVTAVEVYDKASQKLIGRFYFDLYPREGKYKHAAVFGVRSSKTMSDGSRLLPIAAIVCNFPKGDSTTPGLMPHGDVVTFFHEFGHVLHQVLTQADLASFSGTSVARDFVESPSQMFEEWAWSRETLDLFARHYKTGERLPEALYQAMTRSRSFGRALSTQRQLFLAALDQTYHTREPGFDSTKVLAEINDAYTPFAYVEGTHFQASFGHLIGYDAGYYGYQWALSIARDLFTRFQTEGLMNPKTAGDYRAAILAPGGSDEEEHLVTRFLGRAPSDKAYMHYLDGNGGAAHATPKTAGTH